MREFTKKEKRAFKSLKKRDAKKAHWYDKLEDKTDGYIDKIKKSGKSPENFRFFGHNKLLSITILEFPSIYLMGFRNNNEDKDIPWMVKSNWKDCIRYQDECIFEDLWAFECFPPWKDVVNEANMYWLMIPKEEMSTSALDMRKYRMFPDVGDSNDEEES